MKVLVAEDSHSVRNMLVKKLEAWGYDVIAATNGVEAWAVLRAADPPRLVVLDWMMPGVDGVEICRRLRQDAQEVYVAHPYTYVILLTARRSDEDLVTGMNAGADDYIVKPFKTEEFNVRMRAGKRIVALQSQMISAYERLHEEASQDALTGLLNRRAITQGLTRECARYNREGQHLAVLMVDLDHFKQINDSRGHRAGDAVLCSVAARMARALRAYDTLGRMGGEEFLIIVPGCDARGAMAVAERVCSNVSSAPVMLPDAQHIHVTCSIGVAQAEAQRNNTDALVEAADQALYQAKNAGRNQVVVAPLLGAAADIKSTSKNL